MSFELQTKPLPARVAEAFEGQAAEVREVSAVDVEVAMREGALRDGRQFWGLLGATLFVDGKAVGLDATLAVPGRFTAVLMGALNTTMEMHGFVTRPADDDEAGEAEGDDVPKH